MDSVRAARYWVTVRRCLRFAGGVHDYSIGAILADSPTGAFKATRIRMVRAHTVYLVED